MTIETRHRDRIKQTIKSLVEQKVKLTRERREYKFRTRPLLETGDITETERRGFFWGIDSDREDLKHDIRHALLLYGFIRGRDYKQIEKKCRDDNFPRPSQIVRCARDHEFKVVQADVERWLQGEASPWRQERPEAEEAA
jgi:hypothetical protein